MSTPSRSRSRIPDSLQAIFLTSNRGEEVNDAPPENFASRVFGTWFSKRVGTKIIEGPVKTISARVNEAAAESPQTFLDNLLKSRGYSTTVYETIKCAYYNKPTSLQLASYDLHLMTVAKSGNAEKLKCMLGAGLSPNPSNSFGESLLHMVCRRGWVDVLHYLVNEHHIDLQIADDHGRHPLHDCCWASEPNFQIAKVLLERDRHLFYMADVRGSLPLCYVPKTHWAAWVEFLDSVKDVFWPVDASGKTDLPPLALQAPNSRPLPAPKHACTPELAKMVACGRMKPYEAIFLQLEEQKGTNDSDTIGTDDDDDNDDFTDSDDDSYSSSFDSSDSSANF